MDIRKEIKVALAMSGYTLTEVVREMNKRLPDGGVPTTVQNISNKLTRGTIKYNEVKLIADIIGMNLKWEDKEMEEF